MKRKKVSIKWKIYTYLFGFTVLLLAVLWFFQIAYLDVFYKYIKKNQLDDATAAVVEKTIAAGDDLDDSIATISDEYNISILVSDIYGNIDVLEEIQNDDYGSDVFRWIDDLAIQMYATEAKNSGDNTYDIVDTGDKSPDGFPDITKITIDEAGDVSYSVISNSGNTNSGNTNSGNTTSENSNSTQGKQSEESTEGVTRVVVVTDDNNEEKVILLNSTMTPVNATVQTLKVQLIYITGILILLSLVISLLISRRVSKSIIKVNDSALKLAAGDYGVKFMGNDYKEIAELSNTLNMAARELAKTENLQRELIANVSHDLRTPLTMIIGYSEVMRDLPGENTPENVQVVIDEAKRLANLVNDLLDISKIQSGVTPFETKTYDLTKSIEEVLERYSRLVQQNGYMINFEYDEHIFVNADEDKIFQVVYNLVNNAINYIGEDKTVIVRQIVKNGNVRIEVKDNGVGIEKNKLEHVWQRYYRGDKEHNRAIMGTGLGLAIVENILSLHNAEYGVESEFGHGSTFWFEIKHVK